MLTDWVLRMRSLFRRRAVEQELDEELWFHIEQQAAAHMRRGLGRDEAVRRARLDFGGLEQIKEEHRDARGVRLVDDLGQDLHYAVRQFRRSPGFAVLAMLCLGLGIGVNTAIFGVLNSVLLRPMAVAEPERLIMMSRGRASTFSGPDYRDFQARSRVLSGLAASWPMESDLEVDGESSFIGSEAVSANYGDVLRIPLSLGRWFVDEAEPAAVISHAVWQQRFNLSPDVLGRRIQSQSQSYTVVGVATREFVGAFAPVRTDVWVPIRTRPTLAPLLADRKRPLLMLFGRLSGDATPQQASAELNAVDARLVAEQGASLDALAPIVAEPVYGIPDPGLRLRYRAVATLLSGVVGLVLLIACVNVGHLLLVRGAARQREFAVRRALGASNLRLLRQLLTESLVLAAGGGICGLVLAFWTSELLARSVPSMNAVFAVQFDLSLDWRVVVFAIGITGLTTALCGLMPARRASRLRGIATMSRQIRGGTSRRRPLGLVAQVVMSFVLLLVAGSFLQALVRMQTADPGFMVEGRLYASAFVPTPPFTPESGREFYAAAVQRVSAIPGVRRAALSYSLPLMPGSADCAALPDGPQIPITSGAVDTGFFETMGIDRLAGRDFSDSDVSGGASAVILNESLARRLWPDTAPVGERLMVGCRDAQAAVVIGVVRTSAIRFVGEPAQPHLYRPFDREYAGGLTTIVVDTGTGEASMAQTLRRTLLDLGQGIRVFAVQPLGARIEQTYGPARWQASIIAGCGLLALLLAAVGLYGVTAYHVTLRTQEIGVRMALGARREDIFREVVRHGLAIVLAGLAIGEVLTALVTRLAGSIQVGIGPTNLWTHVGTGVIWIVVAFVACYVPAVRAARVDPLVALRCE